MTLEQLREHVMFQTNNDADDLYEFLPAVDQYINEGYNKLVEAYARTYIDTEGEDGTVQFPSLTHPNDVPRLPEWSHRALGDFATYCIYRNGNQYKQQRGERYLQMFNDVLYKLRNPANGKRRHFYNLYTD